jgi:replicative DNA helicase
MSAARKIRLRSFEDLAKQYIAERTDPDQAPVRLGFGSLDARMRGISPGQVCVIAGRTGVGKTFALGSLLHNFTARVNAGFLVMSLEQPGPEWFERQFAIYEDVAHETVEGWAKQGELGRHLVDFLERMQNVVVVEDGVRLDDLGATIEHAQGELKVPLRLVLIDYLGLLGATGRDAYDRTSKIAVGLKEAAKSAGVAIVLASQLSRDGGDGSEPVSITQLRDSGVVEEAADFVIGIWRPGKAPDLGPSEALGLKNVLRVALIKNRKGEEGHPVDLLFRPDSRQVYDPADPFAIEVEL